MAKSTAKSKPSKAAKPAKASKPAPTKAASKTKKPAKQAAPAKAAAKATSGKKVETKSGLTKTISKKAAAKPVSAKDQRRSAAAAALEAALEEEDEEEEESNDDEFDPEAFLAASGGKGLIKSHVMRKERVDLNLPIRFRFLTGPLVFNATLLNLSKTGMCIEGSEKVKPGTALRIEIPLPHTSELFAIQAEVIWSNKAAEASGKNVPMHIGMNFLPMSLAKRTVINNFIQQRRDEIVMAKIGLDRFSESVPVAGLD